MGKTNQPLMLLVDWVLKDLPEVQALVEAGHTVDFNMIQYDGAIGPKFWRMTPELIKYLPMALKAMRKEKRESGEDRKAKGTKKAGSRAKKGVGSVPAVHPEGVPGGPAIPADSGSRASEPSGD